VSAAARPRVRAFAPLALLVAAACISPASRAAIASCTVTATGVVFGIYTPLQAAPLNSNGTIGIACTGVSGRNTVTIDLSAGASGNYLTRTLVAGTFTLNYDLYLDAAYTQVWGNGTGGSVEGSARIRRRGRNVTLTVYGAIAARQDPAPGSYTDNITVSVNY
jgi:spore coat protein U-like protein